MVFSYSPQYDPNIVVHALEDILQKNKQDIRFSCFLPPLPFHIFDFNGLIMNLSSIQVFSCFLLLSLLYRT